MAKRIEVNPVTRIEGHARITLDLDDQGRVAHGHLQVMEIRGFEKLLQKTELLKMPLVTARLCGVCPAAHHLASVAAIEAGAGVTAPRDALLLRELLYAGHMLHSHALSNFVLTGPDLLLGLGAPAQDRNVFHLLQVDAELAKKILRLRSIGQKTVEIVGGRGVHPVTVVPGGISFRPDRKTLETLAGWGREALGILEELSGTLQGRLEALAEVRENLAIPFPPLALSRDGTHSFQDGEVVVGGAAPRRFAIADYASHLVEHVMPGSYMKTVRLRGQPEASYFVGPLARLAVNQKISTPLADARFQALKQRLGDRLSAVDNVSARLVEMVHCAERLAQIAGGELGDGPLSAPLAVKAGRYVGGIEAPRGILVHDYTVDGDGRLTAVNLIVATQNNYDAMDRAVTDLANHLLPKGDENLLLNGMEFALRCYDPCLACATHAAGRMPLALELRRGGRVLRTISRRVQP